MTETEKLVQETTTRSLDALATGIEFWQKQFQLHASFANHMSEMLDNVQNLVVRRGYRREAEHSAE